MRHTVSQIQLDGGGTRRRRVGAALSASVIAVFLAAWGASVAAAQPTVNQEKLVIAAQLDQYRPNNGTTPGGAHSVKLVQRALRRKGYHVKVDGNFGAQTTVAYAHWQHRLGYHRLDANGLPGRTSLKRLGFAVSHRVALPGPHRRYSGVTLDTRTIAMLKAAGRRLGKSCVLDVMKGSYTGPDSSSAGTHAGGGAADISVYHRCGHSIGHVVRALRRVGFAAWFRPWAGDYHIHAVAISDLDMATRIVFPTVLTTREQVADFAQGKDGLGYAVVAPMTIDRLRTWERYKRSH